MRRELAKDARRFGVEEERIPDLVLAVNENATNSIKYTGSGSLGVWQAAEGLSARFGIWASSRTSSSVYDGPRSPKSADAGFGLPTKWPI